MKIKEIVNEAPSASGAIGRATGGVLGTAAKGIGAVAGGVVAAPRRIAKGVAQGAAAGSAFADRLLSPSKWFQAPGAVDSAKDDAPADQPDKQNTAPDLSSSVDNVLQNRPLSDVDKQNFKQLANTTYNPEVKAALEAAAAGQKLTDQQKATLQQLL